MKYVVPKLLLLAALLGLGAGLGGCSRADGGSWEETAGRRVKTFARGQRQDLGTLGGSDSRAQSINGRGQVVGESETEEGKEHAFLWEAGIGMQDLGTLGSTYSKAESLNDKGQVVGNSQTEKRKWHAFLWNAERGMQYLNPLGSKSSLARDINENGQVVGGTYTGEGDFHAFLWEADPR